jgi:hypothetical protein
VSVDAWKDDDNGDRFDITVDGGSNGRLVPIRIAQIFTRDDTIIFRQLKHGTGCRRMKMGRHY